jgi:membrane-bound ClpP family serine protease
MDYLTIALVLMALGVLLLLAEILVPTGGILVVGALLFFAVGVGIILYYGTLTEGLVAMGGLAIGVPAAFYIGVLAWRRLSLDSELDADPTAATPSPQAAELERLKGRTGKTVSPLRPSGSVEFDGKRVDAMTEGTMLDAGVWVRCVDVRWGQVIVRRMELPDDHDVPAADFAADSLPVADEVTPEAPKPPPAAEEPKKPRDDFDDFDIGLDKT